MPSVIERVDRLEDLMAQLLETTAQTSRELREFKNEMREFKNEMHEFKNEMREFKNEMRASALRFEEDMRGFALRSEKDMQIFKDESRHERRELRREIGDIANKTGRLVEDMVAPGIPKIFRDITGLAEDMVDWYIVRIKKKQPRPREFDALIGGGGYVLVNETKSVLRAENIQNFHAVMRDEIRQFFPEYSAAKFIGVVSSLYVDESIVTLGSKQGLYILGFAEDLLDVLNPPTFKPRYF
jgi:hypothetical protein